MAQQCPVPGREHGSHPPPAERQPWVPDRVHATVQAVQTPERQPVLNRTASHPERAELPVCNNSVLPECQLDDLPLTWMIFRIHFMQKVIQVTNSPPA
jgi:hypothetical protein